MVTFVKIQAGYEEEEEEERPGEVRVYGHTMKNENISILDNTKASQIPLFLSPFLN